MFSSQALTTPNILEYSQCYEGSKFLIIFLLSDMCLLVSN